MTVLRPRATGPREGREDTGRERRSHQPREWGSPRFQEARLGCARPRGAAGGSRPAQSCPKGSRSSPAGPSLDRELGPLLPWCLLQDPPPRLPAQACGTSALILTGEPGKPAEPEGPCGPASPLVPLQPS